MGNFWDFSSWGFFNLTAVLLGSLLVGNMLKRSIPVLRDSLIPTRQPLARPSAAAIWGMTSKMWATTAELAAVMPLQLSMWALGTTRMWVGAWGAMSRKA